MSSKHRNKIEDVIGDIEDEVIDIYNTISSAKEYFSKIQRMIDSEEYDVSDMDNYMEELEHYLDEALKLSKSLKDDLY